ncbi:MAG: hypothetical protein ACI8WT_003159 [Clostridium sp.]|jgi:hypothetical protein
MSNLLKFEKSYTYKIELTALEEEGHSYVRGYIEPEHFSRLVFFLNEKLRDMLNGATLTPIDIAELLERFYDFKQIDGKGKRTDSNIELSENWEKHDLEYDNIINDSIYYADGIEEALKDIVFDIVYTNPVVFYEKFMEFVIEKDGVSYIPVPTRIIDEIKKANEEIENK